MSFLVSHVPCLSQIAHGKLRSYESGAPGLRPERSQGPRDEPGADGVLCGPTGPTGPTRPVRWACQVAFEAQTALRATLRERRLALLAPKAEEDGAGSGGARGL